MAPVAAMVVVAIVLAAIRSGLEVVYRGVQEGRCTGIAGTG